MVEQIPFYNRTETLLRRFNSYAKNVQIFDEGFGYAAGGITGSDFVSTPIPAGGSRTVVWRPTACGLCSQRNYLPVAFIPGGAVIEFLLVNTAAEVCDSTGSSSWELSDVKILVDTLTCDPAFITSLSKHLLSGNSLTLSTKV